LHKCKKKKESVDIPVYLVNNINRIDYFKIILEKNMELNTINLFFSNLCQENVKKLFLLLIHTHESIFSLSQISNLQDRLLSLFDTNVFNGKLNNSKFTSSFLADNNFSLTDFNNLKIKFLNFKKFYFIKKRINYQSFNGNLDTITVFNN